MTEKKKLAEDGNSQAEPVSKRKRQSFTYTSRLDSDEDDADDSDFSEELDSEEEFEANSTRKRAKTTHTKDSTQSKPTGIRPLLKLTRFVTLPLDLQYQVFRHLAPVDLIHLSRSNKRLRSILMSRTSASVWISARRSHGIPGCPSEVSEPAWANLWCKGVCEVCGATGIQKIDFQLLRRLCAKCKKADLLTLPRIKERHPNFDVELLEYIPFTHMGPNSHGHASSTKFYWAGDIEKLKASMAKLQPKSTRSDILSDAAERINLSHFKMARLAIVQKNQQLVDIYKTCDVNVKNRRAEEFKRQANTRYENLCNKFIELGYSMEDVQTSLLPSHVPTQITNISGFVFDRCRKEHEPAISEAKLLRLEHRHKGIMQVRRDLITTLYREYQRTLIPSRWAHTPPIDIVIRWPVFRDIYIQNANMNITLTTFQAAAQALPALVDKWQWSQKLALLRALPDNKYSTDMYKLALATSIFESPVQGSPFMIGLDGTLHLDWKLRNPALYRSSPHGIASATALVMLARLDPETALADEMDRLNGRYICEGCEHPRLAQEQVLSWRECIAHTVKHKQTPKWKILEASLASRLTANQYKKDLARKQNAWYCHHCTEYLDNRGTREDVSRHLQTEHEIVDPKEVLFYLGVERAALPAVYMPEAQAPVPVPKPVVEKTPPVPSQAKDDPQTKMYMCKLCPPTRKRLFKMSGVLSHSKVKHVGLPPEYQEMSPAS